MLVQLRRQVKTADLVAYLDTILAAFPTAHEPATQKQERSETGPAREVVTQPLIQPLLDPLSARELEVLELLTQGASNQEIAHHLTVTIHTVKRHVSNIFAKMDVTNRTQAVARSRELGFFNRNEHSGEKTQFHA
jgi:ATP/maltotriose-dependent transcriptional regulator MalT